MTYFDGGRADDAHQNYNILNLVFSDIFVCPFKALDTELTDNLSFFALNSFTKTFLIIFMILGKIEMIAILYIVKKFIFRE